MEEVGSKADEIVRKKRVKLYKRLIVATMFLFSVVPLILSVSLVIRLHNLQDTLNKLLRQKDSLHVSVQEDSQEEVPTEPELKKVYLTFDDGPSGNTEDILRILEEYNVKATFFVVGKTDEKSIERYKAIVASGNSIGLHSYTHDYKKVYSSVESFAAEFNQVRELIRNTTGLDTKLLRFPGGSSISVPGSVPMEEFIRYTKQEGYIYFDWNVSSGDGTNIVLDMEQIVNNVVDNVDRFEEPVVLMHDSEHKMSTVEALPKIIETLIQKGYQPCSIDDTVKTVQHIKAENIN